MPRPIDTSSKSIKSLIAIGAVALLVVLGLTLAMCSTMGTTDGAGNSVKTTNSTSNSTGNSTGSSTASALKEIDSVGNKAAVQFMSETDQEAFAKALHSWMDANGRTWPDNCSIASVKNQTTSTAEIYVKLGDGSYIVCIWVSGTANPFTFDASSEAEALGAGTSHTSSGSASSSTANQGAQSSSTASSGSAGTGSTGSSGSSSASSGSGSSSSSGSSSGSSSSSSSSTGKTPSNTQSPVKASDTSTLIKSLPQKAAYYLPTVTENWLSGKGISASGGDAVVDASTIKKGGVGYTFSGYVKDRSGTVHSLEWEWNESRQQYGMSLK